MTCAYAGCNHPEGECLGLCLNESQGKQKTMQRGNFLNSAIDCVCTDRKDKHGRPENTFSMIADLWEMYLSHKYNVDLTLDPLDVAQMMVLLKIARASLGSYNDDHYIDEAGYSAIAGELAYARQKQSKT